MLKSFLRKIQFPIMLACGAAPIGAVRFALLAPELLYLAWVLPAAMVLCTIPCLLLPKKRLLPGILLGLLYIAAGIWLIFPENPDFHLIAVPMVYGLLLLYTVPMGSWPWYQEPPAILFVLGTLLHLAAQIGISYLDFQEFYALEPIRTGLLICFVPFALMLFLSRSRSSLAAAAREQPFIPHATRWKNLLLILVFFLIVAALSSIGALADGLVILLKSFLRLFIRPPVEQTATGEPTIPSETEAELPAVLIPHTSNTAEALQTLLMTITNYLLPLILFACGVTVLVLIFKYSSALFRKLRQLLEHYISAASMDYEDEITDLRDTADPEDAPAPQPVRLSFLQRRRLSPREKIRYRYQQLKKRNPKWTDSSTARENLASDTAPLYEQARYSDNPISQEDLVSFSTKTRGL